MKRMIPAAFIAGVLCNEEWEATEHIGTAPDSDDLGEAYWGIFKYEGLLYRVEFHCGGTYWQSEMGPWEDPFPGLINWQATEIECERVDKLATITNVYVLATEADPKTYACEDGKKAPHHLGHGCGWPGCEYCDESEKKAPVVALRVTEGATCSTSGFWYDLFEGGYINPTELLDDGAEEVEHAIEVLRAFRAVLEEADALELH